MSINQKNIFGDNTINLITSPITRELTPEAKTKIIDFINNSGANSAVIRFENGGETAEFSEKISQFLQQNNINSRLMPVMMSEIKRNEFTIEKHPSDANYVIIKIGSL